MKRYLRAVTPYFIRRMWRQFRHPIVAQQYSGDFESWDEVEGASAGYESANILEKSLIAARAVRDGKAAWERDSVLFAEPSCNKPLMGALHRIARETRRALNLVDYGGAFGSVWWQHRSQLIDIGIATWRIVELPGVVEIGMREFSVTPLSFHRSLPEANASKPVDVILFASSLPYLRDPFGVLSEVARSGIAYMIIDRTGFVHRGRNRLTIQNVPLSIYKGSYPCWFFDYEGFSTFTSKDWVVINEWLCSDVADIDADFRGMLMKRRCDY